MAPKERRFTYKFASEAQRRRLSVLGGRNRHIVACWGCSADHDCVLPSCLVVGDFDIALLAGVLPVLDLERLEDVEEGVLLRGAQIHFI